VLIQTGKVSNFPVVLVGSAYWNQMLDWIRDELLGDGTIAPVDLELLHVTDDPKVAVDLVCSSYV
jgi:predicted Rossmann-fold nucleotide-binding protein